MAGSRNEHASLPSRGKVQEVRKQWAVHEDGALAYHMQNEEINEHYGLNRFHRQMVREDIPVAKLVHSEEELRLQEQRLKHLAILKAQAEKDAKLAMKMDRKTRERAEVIQSEEMLDLDDEELARQLQERERKKYERHLERKKERKLKKERQMLEEALAKDLEDARLAHNAENGTDHVSASLESLNLHGVTRVTPSGCIEDDGDFSDFYNLPHEMDEYTRLEIQASQDEELARLLQEQEHKRTKAKVDPEKIRNIEQRDEQLARIMQEQEKLKLKKAKLKHQARKEAMRQISVESMPLGASANSLRLQKPLVSSVTAAVAANDIGHHRYRSNSYTQACDSPPSPPCTPPPGHLISDSREQLRAYSDQSIASVRGSAHKNQQYLRNQHEVIEDSPASALSRATGTASSRGMSTLESARQIAAGNPEGILAIQNSQKFGTSGQKGRSSSLQEQVFTPRDSSHTDITHGQQGSRSRSTREPPDLHRLQQPGHFHIEPTVYSQPYKPHSGATEVKFRPSDGQHVQNYHSDPGSGKNAGQLHWQDSHPQSPRAGHFTNRDEDNHKFTSQPSGPAAFNIATAIDPTYQRRHPEASFIPEMQPTISNVSYSLPQDDGILEWDPNLRGSLRKTKTPIHGYQSSATSDTLSGQSVLSSWQPVQGQRRKDHGSRGKSHKQNSSETDGKSNCKQQ